ncbi:MAG: cell division protein FtsQ/DivIB [Lachnospiraceae bacterium]
MGKKKRRKTGKIHKPPIKLLIVFLLILLLAGICTVVITKYRVRTIIVEGNIHYTNEEIIAQVINSRLEENSLYLSVKYRDKDISGIPFIEKMKVNILSADTIKIIVYEKSVAGYIEYLGKYMYFDKDGIVVETSDVKTDGITQITGLNFDYVILHEKLPVEDEAIFQSILDITQLLEKYGIAADKIYFDQNGEMTLYFGGIRVRLGDDSNIDDKMVRLKSILPELEGEKGVLRMENYTQSSKNITFNKDEE